MTIQDFDQALKEEGSKIQQTFGTLMQMDAREEIESAQDDAGGWVIWAT